MDLVTALAAFFHLCFCFDLKYPQVRIMSMLRISLYDLFIQSGQTVADLLQRRCCKYGDDSGMIFVLVQTFIQKLILIPGTRTCKRKDSAERKSEFYGARLYKLLHQAPRFSYLQCESDLSFLAIFVTIQPQSDLISAPPCLRLSTVLEWTELK